MPTANADLRITGKGEVADILKAFAGVGLQLQKMQTRLDSVEAEAKKAGKNITTEFKKVGDRIGGQLKRIAGFAVAALGTAGVVGMFKKAIGSAQSFEFELRKVGTLLKGEASRDLDKYRERIVKLSKETGQSVEVLSSGLFDVISASVKGTDSVKGAMNLLTVSTRAAVGGFTDASTAVDVMTTVLNSYGMQAGDAAQVSDKLLTVARLGKTTFGEMAPELGKVTKVASSAGITLDELGGAIVELTKNGRRINFAMTDVRAIINALLKPTKDLKALFDETGFESGEAALKARGFAGVMELIGEKTGGSTEQLLKFIPQQEAIAGASILAAKDTTSLAGAISEVGDSAGSTDEAYAKMADTFEQKSARFRAQVNELFIRLGNEILPVVTEAMEDISAWVDENSDEIVDFLKDAFTWFKSFGEFVINHGGKIATILASIWTASKIATFATALKSVVASAKALGLVGAGAKVVAGGAAASPALGGAGALLMAQEAQEEGKQIAWDYGDDWREIAETVGQGMADLSAKQLDLIKQGSVYFDQLEQTAEMMFKVQREGAAPTFAQEQKLRDVVKRMVEAQKEARARADREAFEREFDRAEELAEAGAKADEEAGKKTIKKLSDEQKKVLERLRKEREAADRVLRDLEIQAMDEIAQIRARMEDDIADLRDMKFREQEDRERAIGLVRAEAEEKIAEIRKKKADEERKAQDEFENAVLTTTKKAGDNYHKIREDAEATAEKIRQNMERLKRAKEEALAQETMEWFSSPLNKALSKAGETIAESIEDVSPAMQDTLSGIFTEALETAWGVVEKVGQAFLSMFEGLYQKAYEQLKELINKAFEAAAEGEKSLVLTEADRARMEQEMGRPLTTAEARARATAYTPEQLASMEQQGRIGEYEVVGTETPQDRMEEVLATMQSWWENMAQNLGPILDWLTDEAAPALINSIAENVPQIIESLNQSWVKSFPYILGEVVPMLIKAIVTELPGITNALITGIVDGISALAEQLIPIVLDIINGITHMVTQLSSNIMQILSVQLPKLLADQIAIVFTKDFWVEVLAGFFVAMWEGFKDIFDNLKESLSPKGWVKKAKRKIKSWFHDGGMVGDYDGSHIVNALKAHQGMFVSPQLAADEVPIIAQTGERVLSRDEYGQVGGEAGVQAAMRGVDQINQGGQAHGSNVSVHIEHMMSEDTERVVDRLLGSMLKMREGNVAQAIGGVPGLAPKRG